jgi:hypothetical protein
MGEQADKEGNKKIKVKAPYLAQDSALHIINILTNNKDLLDEAFKFAAASSASSGDEEESSDQDQEQEVGDEDDIEKDNNKNDDNDDKLSSEDTCRK